VLIVEDQYLIARDVGRAVRAMGGRVAGSARGVGEALGFLSGASIDLVVLDIDLNGENAFPVAMELIRRKVPFILATGYEDWVLPQALRSRPRIEKPVTIEGLRSAVEAVLS
jgi:two-component SAPR family response regulator